jgi:methyl-accepting chemotaxis protein
MTPPADPGPAPAQAVLAQLDALRGLQRERIAEATETMEREVMAAAASMNQIVAAASGHIASLRRVMTDAGGTGASESAVHAKVDRQGQAVQSFMAKLGQKLAAQRDLVDRAGSQAAAIAAAGRKVEVLASGARLLALNARVEASRATDGRAFGVLADEMKQLSLAIAETNVLIQDLALELRTTLPAIATAVEATRALSGVFEQQLQEGSADISHAVQAQRQVAEQTLHQSDETLASIVVGSQTALSHLQFQDVVAQGLDRLDGRHRACQMEVATLLGAPELANNLAPAAHSEVGGDKQINHAAAGQIVLF